MDKNVAGRGDEHDYDNGGYGRSHARITPRRRFDAAYIQQRKNTCEEDLPSPYGQAGGKVVGLLRAPDRADEGIKHIVHHHAPARDVAGSWVDFLGHIRERGTGAGIRPRHAPVADPRKQHSYHGDENGGDYMAMTAIAERAEGRHRGDRVNHDDAVQNPVPQSQNTPQSRPGIPSAFIVPAILLFVEELRSPPAATPTCGS